MCISNLDFFKVSNFAVSNIVYISKRLLGALRGDNQECVYSLEGMLVGAPDRLDKIIKKAHEIVSLEYTEPYVWCEIESAYNELDEKVEEAKGLIGEIKKIRKAKVMHSTHYCPKAHHRIHLMLDISNN